MPAETTSTDAVAENVTAIGNLLIDTASTAQDAILSVVGTVSEALKPLTEKLNTLPFADVAPKPSATVDAAFGIAEKALASQKEFTSKLFKTSGLAV
jgi:hypothetical protein